MTLETEQSYKTDRGKTAITLPSGVRVVHPFYGPAKAKTLRDSIRADNLQEPKGPVMAEFLATAYNNPHEREFGDHEGGARHRMRKGYFRVFEGHNYDGDSQRLFVAAPDFNSEGRIVMPQIEELEKRIKDGDKSIRVLPFSKLQEGTFRVSEPDEIRQVRPYLELVYGEEGAEQLISDVADKTKRREILTWFPSMPSTGERKLRIATLGEDDGRLVAGSYDYVLGKCEHALGVFPFTGEASAR